MKKHLITLCLVLSLAAVKAQETTKRDTTIKVNKDPEVFTAIQRMAEFDGGLENFYKFLADNIRYPKNERKNNIQGKVYINFIIEKDGSLSSSKVLKGVSKDIDAEAIRVMQSSPKWIPAMQNDKPVRQQYTLPIAFILRDK